MKSLNRKLSKHLVLVVNEKLGNKDYFLLPQTLHQDGETLKQVSTVIETVFVLICLCFKIIFRQHSEY